MTLFKPRHLTVHRPTCLYHQQQSLLTTPVRVNWYFLYSLFIYLVSFKSSKEKSRPTQPSNADLSVSGDDLSVSPRKEIEF